VQRAARTFSRNNPGGKLCRNLVNEIDAPPSDQHQHGAGFGIVLKAAPRMRAGCLTNIVVPLPNVTAVFFGAIPTIGSFSDKQRS